MTNFHQCVLIILSASILLMASSPILFSQTTISIDQMGQSYSNLDGVIVDEYENIDVSNCKMIQFACDYEFDPGWVGAGNHETSDECPGDCAGNPYNPSAGGCEFCWDFMYFEFYLNGQLVDENLIGEAGTFDDEQAGTYISPSFYTNNPSFADIVIRNQNWAATEINSFSNLAIICYTDPITNIFISAGTDLWNDPNNWSLNIVPDICHHVIIPGNETVKLLSNEIGICYSLDVDANADFDVFQGADFHVVTEQD